jgi:hypothetical protein
VPATLGQARMNSSKSLFRLIFQTDLNLNRPIGCLPKLKKTNKIWIRCFLNKEQLFLLKLFKIWDRVPMKFDGV